MSAPPSSVGCRPETHRVPVGAVTSPRRTADTWLPSFPDSWSQATSDPRALIRKGFLCGRDNVAMVTKHALAPLLLALAVLPAQAATLYKSIGPNGTVMFSDMPP